MSRIFKNVDLTKSYHGPKGVQVRELEDDLSGSLAAPGHREENASHHFHPEKNQVLGHHRGAGVMKKGNFDMFFDKVAKLPWGPPQGHLPGGECFAPY